MVGLFVLAMDVLKYGFRIDPVGEESKHAITIKIQPKKPVVAIRFVYVNAPGTAAAPT